MSDHLSVIEKELLKQVKTTYSFKLSQAVRNFVLEVNEINNKYGIKPDKEIAEFIKSAFGANIHQGCLYFKGQHDVYYMAPQKVDKQILETAAKALIEEVIKYE